MGNLGRATHPEQSVLGLDRGRRDGCAGWDAGECGQREAHTRLSKSIA